MKVVKSFELHPLGRRVAWTATMISILYLMIDYASYHNLIAFTYLVFLTGLILPLINIRWGLYYYLIINILSDDTPRFLSLVETKNFTSVHFTTLGPFTLMVYWTLFMLFVLLIYYFTKQRPFRTQRMDKYMFGLILLFLVAGAIGADNLVQFPREYIQDASYIVNMVIFYLFVRIAINREEQLRRIISLIIICFGMKTVVALVYYYLGIGTPVGRNIRVIYESGRNLLGLIFFLCLSLSLYLPEMKLRHKAFLMLFGFATLFNLVTYASRGNLLLAGIGGVLFLGVVGMARFRAAVRARYVIMVLLLAVATLVAIDYMRPGALNFVWWKLRTLAEVNPLHIESYTSYSPSTRVIEAINIFYLELERGSILWGEGLGGWFNDRYYPFPFEILGGSAYPDEHILMGKLFKPHGTELVVFLKTGLLGTLVYYFIMLLFFKETYIIFKNTDDKFWKAVVLGTFVFLPLFFYKNYTSKLQVFFGIALAIVANIQALGRRSRVSPKRNVGSAIMGGEGEGCT